MNNETPLLLTGILTYGGTSQGATDAGTYAIIPDGLSAPNYTIRYTNGSLTIQPAQLQIVAADTNKIYDGVSFAGGNGVRYTGFVNNQDEAVLSGAITYNGTSQGAVNVNTYTIIPGGLSSNNYDIQYTSGNLYIGRAPLMVTAVDTAKVYDGLPYNGGNGVTVAGLVNNETEAVLNGTITYNGTAQGAINTDTYNIVPGGLSAANYAIQYISGTLTVHPASLTNYLYDSPWWTQRY